MTAFTEANVETAHGWLRVTPLPDGDTVHNAFFNRLFDL